MQNEYIDLPINLQDTSNYILEKTTPHPIPSDPSQAASEILKKLQELIKGTQEQLYIFCETVMIATEAQHFTTEPWPSPSSLQELNDTQYKVGAQNIYNEFILRNSLNTLKEDNEEKWLDMVDQSWETYTSIFELEASRIDFHPMLIWNFFENFLNHYVIYHNSKQLVNQQKIKEEWFNKNNIVQIFEKLRKSLPSTFSTAYTPQQFFAFYSIVTEVAIQTNSGNYQRALDLVSKISLKETLVFSKGCGSLLNLLFNISFSYFMQGNYHKSMKLSQTIVTFFQKYRKYYNKSFTEKLLLKAHEKNICLLCINYVFLEEKPKGPIMDVFKNTTFKLKDKQSERISDSFFKMKQNDTKTFLKLISIMRSGFLQRDIQRDLSVKFEAIQEINLFTIIQNYKRIQLKKMAKLLKISEAEVINQIENLQKIGEGKTNWDMTIMNPLLKQKKKVNIEIIDNIAHLESQNQDKTDSIRQWQRYREEVSWLSEKVNKI